ncbi:hypothetical protein ACFQL1_21905 [Halomicroarcula sp. GCM10025709]
MTLTVRDVAPESVVVDGDALTETGDDPDAGAWADTEVGVTVVV